MLKKDFITMITIGIMSIGVYSNVLAEDSNPILGEVFSSDVTTTDSSSDKPVEEKKEPASLIGDLPTLSAALKNAPDNRELTIRKVRTLESLQSKAPTPEKKKEYEIMIHATYNSYLKATNYGDSDVIFEKGNRYFRENNYEKAFKTFKTDKKENIVNLFGAATSARFIGRNREAVGLYTKLMSKRPGFAEAFLGRGISYQRLMEFNKSIADFKKYLSLGNRDKSQDEGVYIAIGHMYAKMEKYSSAKSYIQKGLRAFPSSRDLRRSLVAINSELN